MTREEVLCGNPNDVTYKECMIANKGKDIDYKEALKRVLTDAGTFAKIYYCYKKSEHLDRHCLDLICTHPPSPLHVF